ncbi:Hydroxysteroid dehydrogenase-like protein 2 [Halotydeus destructor]|nr:Hydroxysteroid dehydrogenase-like protein 2 [Halotydeus destructor]
MINTGKLAGKTVFITGASRGIGKAIALKVAKDGANVVIGAKTADAHPKLEGTIFTAAKEVEAAGGKCLPIQLDIRDEGQVANAYNKAVEQFGGIDVVVNNASAISLTNTEATSMKKFDLMHSVNSRGTFLVSKYGIEHLKKSSNPHILTLSPPLDMRPLWFKGNVAYTMAKYGMSMAVLGMSEEFKSAGIAVNALWPRTAIWTAAMAMLGGKDVSASCRKDSIMSDAAYAILTQNSKEFTGNFCVDEELLRNNGITDFDQYACVPGNRLMADFFLPEKYLTPDLDALPMSADHSEASDSSSSSSPASGAAKVFEAVSAKVTDEMKNEINAAMAFVISGNNWFVDAKAERPLKVSQGTIDKADVTFISDEETFLKMAKGQIKAANAFMSGKLKVKGNLGIALKAEKIFKAINKQ